MPIFDYLCQLKGMFDTLTTIGVSLSNADKVHYAIVGLGSEYNTFAISVLARPPFPLYDELIPNLTSQEMHFQSKVPSSLDTVFAAQGTSSHKKIL